MCARGQEGSEGADRKGRKSNREGPHGEGRREREGERRRAETGPLRTTRVEGAAQEALTWVYRFSAEQARAQGVLKGTTLQGGDVLGGRERRDREQPGLGGQGVDKLAETGPGLVQECGFLTFPRTPPEVPQSGFSQHLPTGGPPLSSCAGR